jgi:hypothetical protein
MMRWQTPMVAVCLVFMAAVPAFCQRGTLGINFGQTSDRFGTLSRNSSVEAVIDGEAIVLQSPDKDHGADVVAGGELRFPVNTTNHANEYAFYGGVSFRFKPSLSAGFHIQVHQIDTPPSIVNGETFNRARMRLLEFPGVIVYKFGPAKHAFVQAEGGIEFTPHLKAPAGALIPNPDFEHGYFMRGSVGYNFGKWYAKGTYENRYFKFTNNVGNPNGLYNWRTDMITGGVGVVF